ncbi:2-hydroxyacid dehydrogenase [uncultured Bacteroides sp.]|uniref:2-hydroxyacid dehydrogenase n=1 Tax=uncultured Bacteroides sp. TaxID=162156 RepID=UPI002AA71F1C|nr:2-hydroxyacid dehydrogenase [uncultured Bacteroides sp.]
MAFTIAFFGTQPYDESSFSKKNAEFDFELRFFKGHLNKNNVVLTQGVDAVCIFVNDTADAEIIGIMAANGVKVLALRCAGYNNVDLSAATAAGMVVVRVPAYSPYAVAEHTVALMLALNRRIPRATWRTRDGNFSLHGLLGFDMYGKTAGIIGTGRIAKVLIQILRGFGMNILAYDLYPDYNFAREHQVVYASLDELYHSSDIISLHCPLTEQTKYLINDYSISKMKDGVMIINTGRGQLIHTNALIEGLKNKKIGYAGLDVYEEESDYFYEDKSDRIIDDDVLARLLSFNNVIVTSHQAFFTQEALDNIAVTTLQNVKDFIDKKPLTNEVKK